MGKIKTNIQYSKFDTYKSMSCQGQKVKQMKMGQLCMLQKSYSMLYSVVTKNDVGLIRFEIPGRA